MGRRQAALKRLNETKDQSTRFLRLRMTLAVLIFSISLVVSIPLTSLFFTGLYGFFLGGTSFVQEIVSTNGAALDAKLSSGGSFFLVMVSSALGVLLALVLGHSIVVKIHLLSEDQMNALNARLRRRGILGLFKKEEKKPSRHEFRN